MIYKAGCKINLGLSVLGKRADGYHCLETVLYPVPFFDIVEVIPSLTFEFTTSGLKIDGAVEDNLCVKAFRLLEINYKVNPVKVHLHKIIPFGAGLGGGSSDAVATLKLVSKVCGLNVGDDELLNMATLLGSDCPFFIKNQPALATGIGTDLQPINLDLKGYFLAIIKPALHISTAKAYQNISEYSRKGTVSKAINQPIRNWKNLLVNDFEVNVFQRYPLLSSIKSGLYDSGADYVAMSGSGSSFFGLFKTFPNLDWAFDKPYDVNVLEL